MMNIKSFANWGEPEGQAGGIIHSEKSKKFTRTVPIIKSNSIQFPFFSYNGYYNFYKGGKPESKLIFFDMLLYYSINIMIKTLYMSSFIIIYVMNFTHS